MSLSRILSVIFLNNYDLAGIMHNLCFIHGDPLKTVSCLPFSLTIGQEACLILRSYKLEALRPKARGKILIKKHKKGHVS